MAKLLFRLNGVPDDEADDIRGLMQEHEIDIYETDAGRWLIGVAAIWLRDDKQFKEARALIDVYEQERFQRLQQEKDEQGEQSLVQGLMNRLWQSPLEFFMIVLALLFILGISIYPFVNFL